MSRRTTYLIVLLLSIGVAAACLVYYKYNEKNPDVADLKPDFTLSSTDFITSFEKDSAGVKKYNDKVIQLTGKVSQTIPGDSITTVVIDDEKTLNISIEMASKNNDLAKNLKVGDNVTIKALYVDYIAADPLLASFGEKGSIKLKKGYIVK